MQNRPRARRKTVTGSGSVGRRGSGVGGAKPVGGGHGFSGSGKPFGGGLGSSGGSSGGSGGGGMRTKGGIGCLGIIVVIVAMLFGGGNLFGSGGGGSLFGGGSGDMTSYINTLNSSSGVSSGWVEGSNCGKLNTEVSSKARDKFTTIKGNGKDEITLMVYMCGTDLESRSAMATNDLNEMLNAEVGDNINLIVYTGGCKRWRNSVISNKYNQVYQIKNGKFIKLIDKAGTGAMTDPETLTTFIKYCNKNFPANRRQLILWDHGSGSVNGYGYDENYGNGDAMSLSEIRQAIKDAKTTFDFIGFDACLMATYENAQALSTYADYLIASEETEPGIGWYYTNWLTALNRNTSTSTLELGKMIVDDFVAKCGQKCAGQQTTLSVVDLAELSQTGPAALKTFGSSTTSLIKNGEYKTVATARSGCREFARTSALDQIDFVHFASALDTKESNSLKEVLLDAVKYNKTSSNMTNAYGLSIYFPYRSLRSVDSMSSTYQKIEMDDSYTSCIKSFAQMSAGGQMVSGGSNSFPSIFGSSGSSGGSGGTIDLGSLLGGSGSSGGSTSYGGLSSSDMSQLLNLLLSGGVSDYGSLGLDGLTNKNTKFLTEGEIDAETAAEYISENRITDEDLEWTQNSSGDTVISLSEEQWSMVETADKAMYFDDGEGYIELGLDNVYDFDDDGNLLPDTANDWVAINNQVVAYYHTDTLEKNDGTFIITGYVPAKVNDQRANLVVQFTDDSGYGEIVGVNYDYDEDVTPTEAKSLPSLSKGDRVYFLCDYYTYSGKYRDSYRLGTMTVSDPKEIQVSNIEINNGDSMILYKFTDMYGQAHWTDILQ